MPQEKPDMQIQRRQLPDGLKVITRRVNAPTSAVWAVLADGWLYATWVVGASRIRAVEPEWPTTGSRVHHSFGIWPAVINDSSEVLTAVPERELLLEARGWPAGEAQVHIRLVPGSVADSCEITIREDATSGPGMLVPRFIRQLLIAPRNTEALRRLALIAEGRHRQDVDPRRTIEGVPQ